MSTKEELEEKNTKDALELARNIYNVVTNEKFVKNYDEDMRHKVVVQKYPNFANAYPVVLRLIARDLKYNENAFKKFLEKLKTDPGQGMDGFIMRQADYAKFLYIEESKSNSRHWSIKKANQIWTIEYNHMNKWMKKLKEEEKSAKNEYEEEQIANLESRKKELLDFINTENPIIDELDPDLENYERIALGLEPKSLGEVNIDKLTKVEIFQYVRKLNNYKLSLQEELEEKNNQIKTMFPEMDLTFTPDDKAIDMDLATDTELKNHAIALKSIIISIEKYMNDKNKELEKLTEKYNKQQLKLKKDPDAEWLQGLIKSRKASRKLSRKIKKK